MKFRYYSNEKDEFESVSIMLRNFYGTVLMRFGGVEIFTKFSSEIMFFFFNNSKSVRCMLNKYFFSPFKSTLTLNITFPLKVLLLQCSYPS